MPLDGQEIAAKSDTVQSGQYAIQGLAKGNYLIRPPGGRSAKIYLSADITLDFELPALSISGSAMDEGTGRALSDVLVEIWSIEEPGIRTEARSDFRGRFTLIGLDPGEYQLGAFLHGYDLGRERFSITQSIDDCTVTLREMAHTKLRVRDAVSNAPLQRVMAIQQLGPVNGSRLELILNQEGDGLLPPSLAGSDLTISWFGYAPARVRRWNGTPLDILLVPESTK